MAPDECQKECQSNANCHYWTWVQPAHKDNPKQCYLKTKVETRKKEMPTISGPKYCIGKCHQLFEQPNELLIQSLNLKPEINRLEK